MYDDNRRVVAASPLETGWPDLKARDGHGARRAAMAARLEAWVAAADRLVRVDHLWLGGSFCSDQADPADVDAVLFHRYRTVLRPPAERDGFLERNRDVHSPDGAKSGWGVDGALVSLLLDPGQLVRAAAYRAMAQSNGPDGTRRAFHAVSAASIHAARTAG